MVREWCADGWCDVVVFRCRLLVLVRVRRLAHPHCPPNQGTKKPAVVAGSLARMVALVRSRRYA